MTQIETGPLERGDLEYTAFYCEENVWWLSGDRRLTGTERWVIFMSNRDRCCPMWAQRAAKHPAEPTLWDYHVVLAARGDVGVVIYDLDSTLEFPASIAMYLAATFPFHERLGTRFRPRFRVIEAGRFRQVFASDRSHMKEGRRWKAPPPKWPPIRTVEQTMNLMRFIDFDDRFEGELLELSELLQRFAP